MSPPQNLVIIYDGRVSLFLLSQLLFHYKGTILRFDHVHGLQNLITITYLFCFIGHELCPGRACALMIVVNIVGSVSRRERGETIHSGFPVDFFSSIEVLWI